MAVQAGEAYIPVKADMSGFGKDVEQGVDRETKGAAAKAKSIGAGIAKTVGTAMVVGGAASFVKGVVGDLGRIEKLNAQTASVIESTGGKAGVAAEDVTELADQIERATGIEAEMVQESQNLLLTFTNISGKGGVFERATKAATDMSVAFGQDAKSSAIQLGKALNDPIKGVSALGKIGVQFTAQQKEQIAAMVEAGNVAGAQGIILKELETQVGGSAEAYGSTFPGAVAKLQNSLGALAEKVIAPLIPLLESMVTFLAENEGVMIAVAAVVGGALVVAFIAWAVSATAAAVATVAATLPVLAIGAAIAALAAGIIWAYQNVDIFRSVVDGVASFLTGTVWPAIQTGVNVFRNLGRVAASIFERLQDVVRDAVRFILRQLDRLLGPLDDIAGKVGGVVGKVGGLIGKIPGLAAGGTVTRSGMTWVGEDGPELLRLPRAAQVIPLGRVSEQVGSGGGEPVQLIFQQSGHDPGAVLSTFTWAMAKR